MFLLGASDTYPVKSTGGSATHTQTRDELAIHNHEIGTNVAGSNVTTTQWQFYLTSVSQEVNPDGSKSYGLATNNKGSSKPMDILNPYYAVNIWRRIG